MELSVEDGKLLPCTPHTYHVICAKLPMVHVGEGSYPLRAFFFATGAVVHLRAVSEIGAVYGGGLDVECTCDVIVASEMFSNGGV